MIDDWSLLIDKYTVEGARSKFEEICTQLYHNIYSQENVKNVEVSKGDCGVDIFIGNLGIEPIDVIQCKFFPKFGDSQKSQITKSFKTAINSSEFEVISWTLCLINQFTIKEHQWWSKWKLGNAEYLSSDSIKLTDGLELITLLKKNNLYNIAFDKIDSLKIEELHNNFIVDKHISPEKISNTLSKSSSALQQVKNFIGNSPKAHIKRKETNDIYKWINEDLKSGTKNILVVTGEKGIGKSVILKDLYDTLKKEKVAVLGIKADKYFHSNISELEKNLFLDKITFELLIRKHSKDNKLIIIIDQIDALSYSITSNREFINTYNRLISEFQDEENIRVILSTRNYDLEYDAELSIYNSTKYKKIRVMPLLVDDVIKTLALFDISSPSQKFIELLKTPNNLNIFCSLPNKTKVNFDTISTLKDLYDELWLQLISKNKKLQNKNLIFKLADRMYDSGIAVANIYNDEFYEELTYLKSNNLIIENNKTLQFFHQTFYEYCYSKQFVENNKSLEDYLIKSEQSLYIRSVVKMVVEYLRDFNVQDYIRILKNVLFDNKYRFHLKTLIVGCISIQQNINIEEKRFFLTQLQYDSELNEVFLSGVYSQEWILFFIESNFLEQYLTSGKIDVVWSLLARNINHSPLQVLQYLESKTFDNKQNFIAKLLIQIEKWEDVKLLEYFTQYILLQEQDSNGMANMWYYNILKKIYDYHIEFVFQKIEAPLLKTFDNYNHEIEYSLNKLLEELTVDYPVELFTFLVKVLKSAVEKTKFPLITSPSKIESPFYDSYHNIISLSTPNFEKTIVYHLEQLVNIISKKDFMDFFEMFKCDNDVNILNILLQGLLGRKNGFPKQTIELVKIIEKKNGLKGRDDNFQLSIRNLISKSFNFFEVHEKNYITNLYLNLTCTYDIFINTNSNGKKTYSLGSFGEKKYAFIKSLPSNVLQKNNVLRREYQALFRKFGNIDHTKSLHSGITQSGVVGPPLSPSVYSKMTLNSWKNSMVKFNENYKSKHFLSGGMREHSNQFAEEVAKNPEEFYDLIKNLFTISEINICYISKGIDGLIKGNYDPIKVRLLYKLLIKCNLDREYLQYSNWNVKYFLKTNTIDDEIVNHISLVAKQIVHNEKDDNPTNPRMDSLNSVRGSAVDILLHMHTFKEYEEVIFSTIEEVIENCNISIKASIIYDLAYLNHLNIPRAFNIFKKLISENEITILLNSIKSGQYYNNVYHDEMEDYFMKILENEETQKVNYILVTSYLDKKKYGLKYYKNFVLNNDAAKLCALKVAEVRLFTKETLNSDALSILYEFLESEDIDIAREYEGIILRKFKYENFDQLLEFMREFSKSNVCKNAPHYFLDFLLKCAKDFPNECLELVGNINFERKPNVQNVGFYDKEPIKLVLGIYSKFVSEIIIDKTKTEKCLDILDKMLKHSHLRTNANQAIEMLSE